MSCDKDKPWTWIRYRQGLCDGCRGECCTMPVEVKSEDLVRLGLASEDELNRSPKKVAKKLIQSGSLQSYRDGTGLFMLGAKPNGDCFFLDSKTRLCQVYEVRPQVCRDFPTIGPKSGFCPRRDK